MKDKKLAVIILNWNGAGMLSEFLPSVVAFTSEPEVELIVADNGSDDDSVELLRDRFPSVRIIRFPRNYGFAEGYNRAIGEVLSPYIVLLNSDVEVEEGWWRPLLRFMEEHPEAGAVQPKILSYRRRDMFEHAGAAGGLLDALGYPYCRGRVASRVEKDGGQYDGPPREVAWASGAAMMVRRQAYVDAGGLDPLFFAHMEEIDLCLRMRRIGYKVFALSDSRVFHLGGGSLPYGNPRKTYLNFRNSLLMLHKNVPESRRRKVLFLRRLTDTVPFLMFLLKGAWSDARAVVRAHRDFRRMRRDHYSGDKLPRTSRDVLAEAPGSRRLLLLHPFWRKEKL